MTEEIRPSGFGELLRQARFERGWTQEELAERAALSVQAIGALERGARQAPRRDTVRLLADALGLDETVRGAFEEAARAARHVGGASVIDTVGFAAPPAQAALPVGGFLGAIPSGSLVARDEELRRIQSALYDVSQGSGRLLLLAGEPGVGKTRLAQEATLEARRWGFIVAAGTCYEQNSTMPFYPFFQIVSTLYDAAPPAIQAEMAQRWTYLGKLLPDRPDLPAIASSDSPEERQRLFRAVAGFVQALTESSAVSLFFDDLHWADGSSLELLQFLARQTRGHRVLLLGTYRDVGVTAPEGTESRRSGWRGHPLDAPLLDLRRQDLLEKVAVGRLQQEGTEALMRETVGAGVAPEFATLTHRHTEGNAFFVQEVVRSLVEQGDAYLQDGRWICRTKDQVSIPESLRILIGQRLARLSELTRDVLSEASVLGQPFGFEELRLIRDRGEHELDAALDEALAAGLLRETDGDVYMFNHALTQGVLYAELSGRQRRRLHLAVAEALEAMPERSRRRGPIELARHFREGGAPERAVPYLLQAGDRAEAVFAHGEAEQHFRAALELLHDSPDDSQEATAMENLGRVLRITARYQEALDALEGAARIHRKSGDLEREARVVAQIGFSLHVTGLTDEGVERIQGLLQRIEDSWTRPPSPATAALFIPLAHLLMASGKDQESLAAAERGAEMARETGNNQILAEVEVARSTTFLMLGKVEDGLRVLESVLSLAEAAGTLDTQFLAFDTLSELQLLRGQLRSSMEYRRRALEILGRTGDPAKISHTITNLGYLAFYLGDWKEAKQHFEQAVRMTQDLGSTWVAAYSLAGLGMYFLAVGAWATAKQHLEEAVGISERTTNILSLSLAYQLLAELDLLEHHAEAVRTRLEPLLERPDLSLYSANTLVPVLAAAYLALGEEDRAESALSDAIETARAENTRLVLVDLLRTQGVLCARQHRPAAAQQALHEAISLAQSLSYPYGEARALSAMGQIYLEGFRGHVEDDVGESASASEAVGSLQRALAIFRQLGALKDVERTERALTQLASV